MHTLASTEIGKGNYAVVLTNNITGREVEIEVSKSGPQASYVKIVDGLPLFEGKFLVVPTVQVWMKPMLKSGKYLEFTVVSIKRVGT